MMGLTSPLTKECPYSETRLVIVTLTDGRKSTEDIRSSVSQCQQCHPLKQWQSRKLACITILYLRSYSQSCRVTHVLQSYALDACLAHFGICTALNISLISV
jgi:hypothetical protein